MSLQATPGENDDGPENIAMEDHAARLARIKREIVEGTYETPARTLAAVEAMLRDRRFAGTQTREGESTESDRRQTSRRPK